MRSRVLLLLMSVFFLLDRPSAAAGLERMRERHRGKVLVLNFWATWCAPCREEIPLLVRIQREYGPKGVQVIGASIDEPGDRESAEAFVRRMRINYPIWYGRTTEDMKPLRLATSIPATAVFDRDGRRVFRIVGEIKEADLTTRLDWLLGSAIGEPAELVLPPGITPEHFAEHESGEEESGEHEHAEAGEAHAESEGGSAVPT